MMDETTKSISKKDSITMHNQINNKIKKTVSFKDKEDKPKVNQYKLFYRNGTFEKDVSVKSILRVKRSISVKSTSSSGKGFSPIKKSAPKKCKFKDPIEIVKKVESISEYLKPEKFKNMPEEKVNCSCACQIF